MKKTRSPQLSPRDRAITVLFRVLRHTPPHQLADGLAEGVKLIVELLDRNALLELRSVLNERTRNRNVLGIIDRHVALMSDRKASV